jgi:hypothetical protein
MWNKAVKEGGIRKGEVQVFASGTGKSMFEMINDMLSIEKDESKSSSSFVVYKYNTVTGEYYGLNK